MKSYKHLWEVLISDDNIRLAIINAARGNMKRAKLTYLRNNIDASIPRVAARTNELNYIFIQILKEVDTDDKYSRGNYLSRCNSGGGNYHQQQEQL